MKGLEGEVGGSEEKRTRTTHLVDLVLVHLFALPQIAFDLLGVHLPFGQKTNLRTQSVLSLEVADRRCTYDVHRVVHISVCPELAFYVFIPQQPHLLGQMASMGSQQAAI